MSLIRIQNVTMAYENRIVLRDLYFRLWAGERVGMIGKNGAGKTTLLKLILEQLEPVSGQVERDPDITIGYFSQFSELDDSRSIQEILEGHFAKIRALEAEMAQIATFVEEESNTDKQMALLERQSEVIDQITELDGWDYQRHIDTALSKLGFNAIRRSQPVAELSGGWRNRA